eukprot:5476668-Prymnesium_polylepis.1
MAAAAIARQAAAVVHARALAPCAAHGPMPDGGARGRCRVLRVSAFPVSDLDFTPCAVCCVCPRSPFLI